MNSNTPTQTATPNPVPVSNTLPTDIPIAWREFAAGMEFLRRYGAHNTANTTAISRDNLRLLHRSLLQDSEYRQQVHNARKEMPQYGRPTRTSLLATHQLSAQLIHIPANSNIRLTVRPGELGMLMVLSGSLGIDNSSTAPTHPSWWPQSWRRSRPTPPRTRQLKNDDILCIRQPTKATAPRLLTTGKKSCVVLAVFNHQQHPAHPASPEAHAANFPTQQLQSAV